MWRFPRSRKTLKNMNSMAFHTSIHRRCIQFQPEFGSSSRVLHPCCEWVLHHVHVREYGDLSPAGAHFHQPLFPAPNRFTLRQCQWSPAVAMKTTTLPHIELKNAHMLRCTPVPEMRLATRNPNTHTQIRTKLTKSHLSEKTSGRSFRVAAVHKAYYKFISHTQTRRNTNATWRYLLRVRTSANKHTKQTQTLQVVSLFRTSSHTKSHPCRVSCAAEPQTGKLLRLLFHRSQLEHLRSGCRFTPMSLLQLPSPSQHSAQPKPYLPDGLSDSNWKDQHGLVV